MTGDGAPDKNPYCVEDLAQLAASQYRLADRYCDRCRNFHALWPYRRVARIAGAAEAGGGALESILADAFARGRRKVVIAGAADTGLLALTARAGAGRDIEITVIDRCRTPLELCRQFAQRWSINAQMLHQDLSSLEVTADFDVVFANSVLQFIASECRVDFLSRLRRALRADGLLVNLFNTGAPLSVEVLLEYRSGYAGWVLAELDRLGISVPESREKFSQRLGDYARELESREGAFDQPEQVLALHERAGFAVESCVETDLVMTAPFQQLIVKLTKRRHIIVATPTAIRVGA